MTYRQDGYCALLNCATKAGKIARFTHVELAQRPGHDKAQFLQGEPA
jgi:hypothetical protein